MSDTEPTESLTDRLFKEPTAHFFAMAAVIFIVYGLTQLSNQNILELDQREIDARIFIQEMTEGQPLTEAPRQLVATTYV